MSDYFLHPKARIDLEEIWLYGLEKGGVAQANKYITELENRFQWLSENPLRGNKRNYIDSGCLSYFQGSHIIFYKQERRGIKIARVLHQRMNVPDHFGQIEFPENLN